MTGDPDAGEWLSLGDAAARLGLSRHQLRRRVHAGQIASRQVVTQHGPAYEIRLDPDVTMASTAQQANGRHRDATATVTPPLAELVALVRDTQQQLLQATAAAAMWQARAEHLASQLEDAQRALPAADTSVGFTGGPSANGTDETTEKPSDHRNGRPWWRVW